MSVRLEKKYFKDRSRERERFSTHNLSYYFGSDCEEGWAKAEAVAIAEYNENNVDADLKFLS